MPLLLAVLAAAGLGALFYFRSSEAATMEKNTDLFDKIASKYPSVDADLLRALAFVESNNNPNAVRWNPPNDVSVGLMQILCTPPTGAQRGEDYICQNRFDIQGWPLSFDTLRDPETSVDIAAQILSYNLRAYGSPRGIAVYNDFRARHAGVNGPFPNDAYVEKVLARFYYLKGKQA